MSFADETDDGHRRKDAALREDDNRKRKRRVPTSEVGHALRSAYDEAMREDIPPEMLDLLGKLG